MSYTAFITRDKNYPFLRENLVDNPIHLGEWLTVVKNDSTLSIALPDDASVVHWEKFDLPFIFDLEIGEISVRDPTNEVLEKMLEIAAKIHAWVRGSEGEFYKSGTELFEPDHLDFKKLFEE